MTTFNFPYLVSLKETVDIACFIYSKFCTKFVVTNFTFEPGGGNFVR